MKSTLPFVRVLVVLVVSVFGVLLMLRSLEAQAPQEDPGDNVPPGNAAWGQVVGDGFGDGNTWHIPALEVFGEHLYAGTSGPVGAQLWRTDDLLHWSNVVTGDIVYGFGTHVLDMAVFDDRLFAATYLAGSGSELWVSGDGATWSRVVERNGLGPRAFQLFEPMQVYSDHLYVSVASFDFPVGGNWIWRTADGTHWEDVSPPFPAGEVYGISAMAVFSGHLYAAGTMSPSGQIWRTDGISWTAVVTDRLEGKAWQIQALEAWQGHLYAMAHRVEGIGTWRSPDGVQWTAVEPIATSLGGARGRPALVAFGQHLFLFDSPEGSLAAWRSHDGTQWLPIGSGGLGDPYNALHGRQAVATFEDQLLVGTLHYTATGGQIWQYLTETGFLPAISNATRP